jgi:hypothetical protein
MKPKTSRGPDRAEYGAKKERREVKRATEIVRSASEWLREPVESRRSILSADSVGELDRGTTAALELGVEKIRFGRCTTKHKPDMYMLGLSALRVNTLLSI